MRLTMFTDFALRTLILAASNGGRNTTIEEAAAFYGISAPHLKKVVRTLTGAGFLEAQRGRSGGFRLARAPEQINLGQVIRATESDFAMVECFRQDNRCRITHCCRLPSIINRAIQAMLDVFDRHTLADLMLDEGIFGELPTVSERRRQPVREPGGTSSTRFAS